MSIWASIYHLPLHSHEDNISIGKPLSDTDIDLVPISNETDSNNNNSNYTNYEQEKLLQRYGKGDIGELYIGGERRICFLSGEIYPSEGKKMRATGDIGYR